MATQEIQDEIQEKKKSHLTVVIAVGVGLVAFYSLLYMTVTGPGFGAIDWDFAFRNGARGEFSRVVTPYWALFISFLPALLPDPLGYVVWLAAGVAVLLVAIKLLGAPFWPILLSYQLNWCLFYGQFDLFLVFGLALGYWACKVAKPMLVGIAILLLLVKPQVGALVSLAFLVWSPNRKITVLTVVSGVALSLAAWPGWPLTLLDTQYRNFLSSADNLGSNTSPGLAWWMSAVVVVIPLLLPMERKQKLLSLVAASLLASPYSTIYSQLALLSFRLPRALYVFAFLPWVVALIYGPFYHWGWAFLFPLAVLAYCCYRHWEPWLNRIRKKPQ